MRDDLAEELLARVMGWTYEDIARERPDLQVMAKYKYDNYQRFSPGLRFLESLALWLEQFKLEERTVAYEFIKRRLIFCSEAEMAQLVSMAYPDYIRPLLLKEVAQIRSYPEYQITKIANSQDFKILRRQSLFLGLSDGSRIDLFRRLNKEEISHEQISMSYDISETKAKDLKEKLRLDLEKIMGEAPNDEICRFRCLFLLDDFSGSGKSYFWKTPDRGSYTGKIWKVFNDIESPDSALSKILDEENLIICVLLYMATEQAMRYLDPLIKKSFQDKGYRYALWVIQQLGEKIRVQNEGQYSAFCCLVDKYYDPNIETEATRVGGTKEVKFGFASCSLPLVLSHNTPNNSFALLWSPEHLKIRGLFPRVPRH
jgi:hypothetical protein